jgi:hypothetical protein
MTNWTRKFKLGIAAVVAVAATGALSACFSDSTSPSEPTATAGQAQFSRTTDPRALQSMQAALAQGLLWQKAPPPAESVSKINGPRGGSVDFGETGLHLTVPRGAVSVDTRFTVTALPGNVVAYDFEPHGSFFAVPLKFSQDLGPTNFGHIKLPPGFNPDIQGAYFSSPWSIDQSSGMAVVQELIPADDEWTWSGHSISFPIRHFSGYLISTGRSSSR